MLSFICSTSAFIFAMWVCDFFSILDVCCGLCMSCVVFATLDAKWMTTPGQSASIPLHPFIAACDTVALSHQISKDKGTDLVASLVDHTTTTTTDSLSLSLRCLFVRVLVSLFVSILFYLAIRMSDVGILSSSNDEIFWYLAWSMLIRQDVSRLSAVIHRLYIVD